MRHKNRVINLLEYSILHGRMQNTANRVCFGLLGSKIVNIRLFFSQGPLFGEKTFPLLQIFNFKNAKGMKKEEMVRLTNMIAERTADIVMERLNGSTANKVDDDEYVDSKEAARILDVTPRYLCSMKHKFPHKKVGNHSQGRVLFKKSELLANYIK